MSWIIDICSKSQCYVGLGNERDEDGNGFSIFTSINDGIVRNIIDILPLKDIFATLHLQVGGGSRRKAEWLGSFEDKELKLFNNEECLQDRQPSFHLQRTR
jgi:hypothetical protein